MRVILAILVLGCFLPGCGRDDISRGGGGGAWPVDAEDIAPACAIYSGCMQRSGISGCVMFLTVRGYFDPEVMPFLPEEEEFILDWPTAFALAQNIKCVLRAGADCEGVLACLNQGTVVRGCDYPGERRCLEDTLKACIPLGEQTAPHLETAEISTRCDDLGLSCVEMHAPGGNVLAACADKSDDFVNGAEVECEGSVASVHIGQGIIKYDCAVETGECMPGTYQDLADIGMRKFCNVPACDEAAFEKRCVGDTLKDCYLGREANVVCGALGLVCREVQSEPVCTYPSCAPLHISEECDNGVVTYCGPHGMMTISCTELGFAGCETGARCVN